MLQQTQVDRVLPKYEQFIKTFPDFSVLAQASLHDVLKVWQGLGYNRRALSLHETAKKVITDYDGILPSETGLLLQFPGIGPYTASAIAAFAFNQPVVFIETNIRSVFIHFFFNDRHNIHDRDILPLVDITLDRDNPRHWYYALMDYGVIVKKTLPNPSRKSAHYQKQSRFKGSDRQIRGKIVRLLANNTTLTDRDLIERIDSETERSQAILDQLEYEGFIIRDNGAVSINDNRQV